MAGINVKSMLKKVVKNKKAICAAVLTAVVVIFAAVAALFRIGSIEVLGAAEVSEASIIESSGLKVGQSIVLMYMKNPLMLIFPEKCTAAEQIFSLSPLISDVQVDTSGSKVIITVKESKPAFYLNIGSILLLLDENGKIFSAAEEKTEDIPVFKGIELDTYSVGGTVPQKYSNTLKLMKKVADAVYAADAGTEAGSLFEKQIDYIEIGADGNIVFFCGGSIVINIGGEDGIQTNVAYARKILLDELAEGQTGYVDFTTGPNPVFMPDK